MTAERPDGASVFAVVARQVLERFPGDEQGRMLHAPGLRTAGTFYAFVSTDGLVVKLPAARVDELVATGVGLPCATRPGRPMKQWVVVPGPDESSCLAFVLEARAFVASLAAR